MKTTHIVILFLLIGFQTSVMSMDYNGLGTQVNDSISPNGIAKKQLTPKEIKNVIIADTDFNRYSCFQIMQGVIRNTADNKPMHNVHVILSLNGKVIKKIVTDNTGQYQLKLLCNKTYDLKIKITGFEGKTITFKSDIKTNTIIKKDIYLDGAYCYQTISGTIRSSKNATLISGASVTLLKNNKKIKTVKTLEDGTYSFSLDCYKTYSVEVEKEHYTANSILFNTSLVPQMALIRHFSLQTINCTKTINGVVKNEKTNTPMNNVDVELSKDGRFVKATTTNTSGKFSFDVPCNSVFTLSLQKLNFQKLMRALESDSNDKKARNVEFKLKPLDCKQIIKGIVRNSSNNSIESDVKLQFFNANKLVKTITTGVDGSFTFNAECFKSYKVTTSKPFYTDGSQYFVSGNKNNSIVNKTIKISPVLDFIQVREMLMVKVNPNNLSFVLNKNTLTDALIKELNKVITIMEKHPYIRLEINIHTDSRANDNLNMSLSKERAQKIIDYLISKDISSDRLTGDGYGETQLLNHCSNGVKCKNYEHLKNRRIEFIVLDN
ncbi:MAG: hypothetical protein COB81_03170 [Flavobacteriaceae bacterium]|nr:MAG: hypothetical protein COB81_03170 [Flavobacteriaceae bacterium]